MQEPWALVSVNGFSFLEWKCTLLVCEPKSCTSDLSESFLQRNLHMLLHTFLTRNYASTNGTMYCQWVFTSWCVTCTLLLATQFDGKWGQEMLKWDLVPKPVTYTIAWRFSHASHLIPATFFCLQPIIIDVVVDKPQCCDHLCPVLYLCGGMLSGQLACACVHTVVSRLLVPIAIWSLHSITRHVIDKRHNSSFCIQNSNCVSILCMKSAHAIRILNTYWRTMTLIYHVPRDRVQTANHNRDK